jgi:hypothetical protein
VTSPRGLGRHAFAQRVSTLEEIFEANGSLRVIDATRRTTRYLRFLIDSPGHALPTEGTFDYEEWYRWSAAAWRLTDYQYELRLARGGRMAFHWHDGRYHFHCQEAAGRSDDHYRGHEVDLLDDARPSLRRLAAVGAIDCSHLHPLPRRARERA